MCIRDSPLPVRKSVSPEEQSEKENPMLKQLKEAFPNIEEKYVKAVLIASQGQLDPAFNALLFISDPDFEKEAPLPTRPVQAPTRGVRREPKTQLEQDEELARQLDKKFNKHGNSASERTARERRIRPVSYTHLDVYKRQVLTCAICLYLFTLPSFALCINIAANAMTVLFM